MVEVGSRRWEEWKGVGKPRVRMIYIASVSVIVTPKSKESQ